MKANRRALLLLLLLASAARGQGISLPAEIKGDVATFIAIRATTDGTEIRWYSPDPGLSVFPAELLTDKKATVVVAQRAGRYRLIAWTAIDGKPSGAAQTVVVIGGVGPDPKPDPDPPDPKPKPDPEPSDDFYKALKAAWQQEPPASKAYRKKLAALYGEMAVKARDDKSILTALDLHQIQVEARKRMIGDFLPGVRGAIGAYLDRVIGIPSLKQPLNEKYRTAYQSAYSTISRYLEVLP